MELYINKENNKIIVGFNKKHLTINLNKDEVNDQWKTDYLNTFLIDLSAAIEADATIEVNYDKNETHKTYQHVVELFQAFANEYNHG